MSQCHFASVEIIGKTNQCAVILGDPGADSGARESRNGQKNGGRGKAKKSQGQNEGPLGTMFLHSSS